MLRTVGVVEIDGETAAEDRLGGGSLAERRFGGRSLVEWVARRVTEAQQLDAVVIVADRAAPCSRIRRLAPPDTPLHISAAADSLGRLAETVRRYPCQAIVRVRLRDAFVDPVLIDRLVSTAAAVDCDYVGFRIQDGCLAMLSRIGMFAAWFRSAALQQADRESACGSRGRCPARHMLARADRYRVRMAAAPPALDRADLRLAIELEDDWGHAHEIIDALGPDQLDWQAIAELLDRQPEMRQRMARLNAAQDIASI